MNYFMHTKLYKLDSDMMYNRKDLSKLKNRFLDIPKQNNMYLHSMNQLNNMFDQIFLQSNYGLKKSHFDIKKYIHMMFIIFNMSIQKLSKLFRTNRFNYNNYNQYQHNMPLINTHWLSCMFIHHLILINLCSNLYFFEPMISYLFDCLNFINYLELLNNFQKKNYNNNN